MTKKDFISLAETLRNQRRRIDNVEAGPMSTNPTFVSCEIRREQWNKMTLALADWCANQNGAFRRATFLSACGFTDEDPNP